MQNDEYGRKHTDGSRSGGQPPNPADVQDSVSKVTAWIDGGCSSWGVPADEIRAIIAALQQSRSAVEILAEVFADHEKVNSLDWTDRAGAAISQESADA